MRFSLLNLTLLGLAIASAPTYAATVTYADLTSSGPGTASGTIGGVSFTYTGETDFVQLSGSGNTNFFQPTSTYTSATVSNAPSDSALIAITGNGVTVNTFNFSAPVSGLIFSEVSEGQNAIDTKYFFNTPFTVLSCGANAIYAGGCFDQAVGSTGTTLSGTEADGTIEFAGPITTLSFTTANGEYWNGFDIGLLPQVAATPEPSSIIMVGTGIAGLLGAVRRKFTA